MYPAPPVTRIAMTLFTLPGKTRWQRNIRPRAVDTILL
jgi:hypothetical protein